MKKLISKPKEDPIEPINLEDGKCLMCGEQSTRECPALQAKAVHVFMCRNCCLACGMIKEKCKERIWKPLQDLTEKGKGIKTRKNSNRRDVNEREKGNEMGINGSTKKWKRRIS